MIEKLQGKNWKVLPTTMPEGRSAPALLSVPGKGILILGGSADSRHDCLGSGDLFEHSLFFDTGATYASHRLTTTKPLGKSTVCGLLLDSYEENDEKKDSLLKEDLAAMRVQCQDFVNGVASELRVSFENTKERGISWFYKNSVDASNETKSRAKLWADLESYWEAEVLPRSLDTKLLDLRPICSSFQRAADELTMSSIFEVLARFTLRSPERPLLDFKEDSVYSWLAIHWYGACLAASFFPSYSSSEKTTGGQKKFNGLALLLSARANSDAYASYLNYGYTSFLKVFSLRPENKYLRDDVCAFKYRELGPSFVHGFVWQLVMMQRQRGLTYAEAVSKVCDVAMLHEIATTCFHGLGHATFFWALADANVLDVSSLTTPLAGAFATPKIDLADRIRQLSNEGRLPLDNGARHSTLLYVDYDAGDDRSFWDSYVLGGNLTTWPTHFAPIKEPCDFDITNNLDHALSHFTRTSTSDAFGNKDFFTTTTNLE